MSPVSTFEAPASRPDRLTPSVSLPLLARQRAVVRGMVSGTGAFERAGMAFLLLASAYPYSPPTVPAIAVATGRSLTDISTAGAGYASAWSVRPFGGLSVVELAFVALAGLWVLRTATAGERRSSLDLHMLTLAVLVGGLHLFAVARGEIGLIYQGFDLERIGLVFVGYFVVSRMWISGDLVRVLVTGLAAFLVAVAAFLVIRHGLIGTTSFVASDGKRTALLITEDTLLVGFPAVLAWGRYADGLLGPRAQALVLGFLAVVVLMDLLSLRRASLVLLVGVLLARGLRSRRRLGRVLAIVVVAGALAVAAGPARSLGSDLVYTAQSVFLQTSNASTSQRFGELRSLGANADGTADVLAGRGLGALWNAYGAAPIDIVSFGSKETAFVRIGWHIVGLEWLYKLGALGVIGVLLLLAAGALRIRDAVRHASDPVLVSYAWSLALFFVVLLQNAFANPRLALFAGVSIALVSKIMDSAAARPARRRQLPWACLPSPAT